MNKTAKTEQGIARRNLRLRARATLLRYRLGELLLGALRAVAWPRSRPANPRRVCVFRPAVVGDMAAAIPALYAIREAYPAAHLSLVTWPHRSGRANGWKLLEGAKWVDEIIVYDRQAVGTIAGKWKMLRDLRARRPDVWFELPSNHWSLPKFLATMLLARLAGVRWAYGWQLSEIRGAAQAQSEWLDFPCEVERLLGIVQRAGIECRSGPVWPLPITDEHRRRIDGLVNIPELNGKCLVALAPWSATELRRWPTERFADVCRKLTGRGFGVVAIGGGGEADICAAVAEAGRPAALNLAGHLTLLESCELLRRCDLLISNDSGPQHLAAAVGTPCISLFSFWQVRGKWRPWGARNVVIQKWVECHTCLRNQCPYDNRCITMIQTGEVIREASRLLSRTAKEPPSPAPCAWRSQPSLREHSARPVQNVTEQLRPAPLSEGSD